MDPRESDDFDAIVSKLRADYPELRSTKQRIVRLLVGVFTLTLAGLLATAAMGSSQPVVLVPAVAACAVGAVVLTGRPRRRHTRPTTTGRTSSGSGRADTANGNSR